MEKEPFLRFKIVHGQMDTKPFGGVSGQKILAFFLEDRKFLFR